MRLEEDEQSAAVLQRLERCNDLGRMVGIVVVHLDVSGFAPVLEPARRASKLHKHACSFVAAHARELERG